MTIDQFEDLTNIKKNLVTVADLNNKEARTLLYGYDCNRDTWHVYLDEDKIIHIIVYEYVSEAVSKLVMHKNTRIHDIFENEKYVPDKRLYPEACDAEFSRALISAGVVMPWTTFNDRNFHCAKFYGKTFDDF